MRGVQELHHHINMLNLNNCVLLTQHSDDLFVIVSRVSSLAILSVGGLPDLALARLHDHLHHGDVEEDQDDDGYEEEEYEGELVHWIPL